MKMWSEKEKDQITKSKIQINPEAENPKKQSATWVTGCKLQGAG